MSNPIQGPLACSTCKGSGRIASYLDSSERPCSSCGGSGLFEAPDADALIQAVTCKGKGGRRFRRSWPRAPYCGALPEKRAYYVWRLTRFHGGADVTLPMTAEMLLRGDPYVAFLDLLARKLASVVFGSGDAGGARWRAALTGEAPPAGLPDSAYESEPVADSHKPAFERAELH